MGKFKYLILVFAATIFGTSFPNKTFAEETSLGPVAKFFTDMPLSVMELINRNRRLDMLDYFAADSIYRAPNGMEGFSYLEKVTPDYLLVSLTPVSKLSIASFTQKGDTIYQCIYTLGSDTQAHDSEIKFYDSKYNLLTLKNFFTVPELSEFYDSSVKDKKDLISKINQVIPFPTITYTYNPETSILTAHLTSGEIIGSDEYNKISNFIQPELRYIWNGKRYQLQKSSK